MVNSPMRRLAQSAIDADKVAQIEFLGQLPALFADLLLAEHDLHSAGPVPDVDEKRLALAASLDDSPGGPHPQRRHGVVLQSAHLAQRLMAIEATAPRIDPQFLDMPQLIGSVQGENVVCVGHFVLLSFPSRGVRYSEPRGLPN